MIANEKKLEKKQKEKKLSLIYIVRRLIPIAFRAIPAYFTATILVAIVHGASFGIVTIATQWFFDAATKAATGSATLAYTIMMLGVLGLATVFSQTLNGVHNFMSTKMNKHIATTLAMRIHEKSAGIDPVLYETPSLLDDINKAREGMEASLWVMGTCVTLFTFYTPFFSVYGVYLFRLKPVLALALLIAFVPALVAQLLRVKVYTKLEEARAPIAREMEYYEKTICDREYYKETRLLGAFSYFRRLYRETLLLLGRKTWEAHTKSALYKLGMNLLSIAGHVGVLLLAVDALIQGEISVGAFAAVLGSISMLFAVMEEIVTWHFGAIAQNIGKVRNFMRFLDLPERGGQEISICAGDGVEIKDASFRYPGAERDSLSHINLTLRKGEIIAIVGENGAGKSTLVRLMTGLYLPTDGNVYLGGVDTKTASPQAIYKGISAVVQKFQKYKLTLTDNISVSATGQEASAERISSAVSQSGLHVEEGSFPQGYDTVLSREFDGVELSGGQWQRVAIARGFYRAHEMIVLDEPTAAIDPIEETRVYHKFAEISKGKTAIIVTHRLGSTRIANRIVVMDSGKIDAIGTHEELMVQDGKYAQMFRAQSQWYEMA